MAELGDGWYGLNLAGLDAVGERLAVLEALCREAGRDMGELELAVALKAGQPEDLSALNQMGVSELVLVETPPEDPRDVADWDTALASRWSVVTG